MVREAAREAARRLASLALELKLEVAGWRILVQEMVESTTPEIFVGLKLDETFGHAGVTHRRPDFGIGPVRVAEPPGGHPHVHVRIRDGARATLIAAPDGPMAAYKQWIAGSLSPTGILTLDAGAVTALKAGKSLLPAGVTAVSGAFGKGDSVRLLDEAGLRVGVGLVAYGAREAALIRGRRSDEIETLLGYPGPAALIHRDDLAI